MASLAGSACLRRSHHGRSTLYDRTITITITDAAEVVLNAGVGFELAKEWVERTLSRAPEHSLAEAVAYWE